MLAGALRAYLLLLDQSVDMKSTATDGLVGNAIFLGEKFLYCLAEDGDRADLGAIGFSTPRAPAGSMPLPSVWLYARSPFSRSCAPPNPQVRGAIKDREVLFACRQLAGQHFERNLVAIG